MIEIIKNDKKLEFKVTGKLGSGFGCKLFEKQEITSNATGQTFKLHKATLFIQKTEENLKALEELLNQVPKFDKNTLYTQYNCIQIYKPEYLDSNKLKYLPFDGHCIAFTGSTFNDVTCYIKATKGGALKETKLTSEPAGAENVSCVFSLEEKNGKWNLSLNPYIAFMNGFGENHYTNYFADYIIVDENEDEDDLPDF